MTDINIQPLDFIANVLRSDDSDPIKEMLALFAQVLMHHDANAQCGAQFRGRNDERVNQRNGYRTRRWDTRAGTINLNIPKLRRGSYYPDWLLEPRRRAEKALQQVIVEAYVKGISTRRVDGLVKAMGIDGISKSQVAQMAQSLDETADTFRNRPLDAGPYAYVWVDALVIKCRDGGRVRNLACLIAVGVNADGRREVLGVDVATSESGTSWLEFLRGLVARGLSGVQLVISDAHSGLVDAIGAALPGASWQRCRTHFMRNVLSRVPKKAQPAVATVIRGVFDQPDAKSVEAQYDSVIEQLAERFPRVADLLESAKEDVLAFRHFPQAHWKQIRSNNPQERLNKEIRRRTDVVGIFPNRAALIYGLVPPCSPSRPTNGPRAGAT
jgi:transposase-like protein